MRKHLFYITNMNPDWLEEERKMAIPEYTPEGWIRHKFLNESRHHVLSYSTSGIHCSEKNCEINHQN